MQSSKQSNKREEHERKAQQYLDSVKDRYFFDGASGVYKKKTIETHTDGQQTQPGHDEHVPFWAVVKRDWLVVCISALTLLLLLATVILTRRQWKAIDKQYPKIAKSADAAHDAAAAAQQANTDASTRFRQDERPYIITAPSGSDAQLALESSASAHTSRFKLVFWFHNYGRSPAVSVHYAAHLAIGESQISKMKFGEPTTYINPVPPGDQPQALAYSEFLTGDQLVTPLANQRIILYGVVKYTDIFGGQSPSYVFEFCVPFVNGPTRSEDDALCREHNYMK